MRYLSLLVLLFTCILSLNSCESETSNKGAIRVLDATMQEVSLKKPAKRVIVLFEPLLDGIYMLRAGERIVGISSKLYTNEETFRCLSLLDERIKNKKIKTPGDEQSLNIESIIALKPDLVIGYSLPEASVQTLRQMGIAVYLGKSETYQDTEKELTDLGILLGKEKRSHELLDFAKKEFEKIKSRGQGQKEKTAYFSWANGRIFTTAGTESMMGQCLDFAGVRNVATSKIDMPNINPEILVSWNPDLIFTWNDRPEVFYNHPQLQPVRAVKERQVFNLMPMFFYNPHNLKALLVATRLQNWAYNLRPEKEVQQDLKTYLNYLYGQKNASALYSFFDTYQF